jgi:hypothetical protein
MSYKPSDAYYKEFTTASPSTGAAQDADSLPTATANHNGTDDGSFSLTVTNLDTGRYKISATIPGGYARGDVVNVTVAATVATVAGKACVDTFVIDSKRVGDLNDLGGVAQTGDAFARIGASGAGLTAVALAGTGVDGITAETGINLRQAVAVILDAVASLLSGATGGPTTILIKDPTGAHTRIAANVDVYGNRSAVTITPPV